MNEPRYTSRKTNRRKSKITIPTQLRYGIILEIDRNTSYFGEVKPGERDHIRAQIRNHVRNPTHAQASRVPAEELRLRSQGIQPPRRGRQQTRRRGSRMARREPRGTSRSSISVHLDHRSRIQGGIPLPQRSRRPRTTTSTNHLLRSTQTPLRQGYRSSTLQKQMARQPHLHRHQRRPHTRTQPRLHPHIRA